MEQVFIRGYVEVSFDPNTRILYVRWQGFQSKEGIQEAGQIILNEISQKKITKVLNDNSEVIGHWHGAADWTQQVWFPSVFDAGLKHFAWIMSTNMFATLSAKRAMPANTEVVKLFDTNQEALEWLTKL